MSTLAFTIAWQTCLPTRLAMQCREGAVYSHRSRTRSRALSTHNRLACRWGAVRVQQIAPPSPTMFPRTHISTRESGRQLQLSPASRLLCRETPSWQWKQRWQSTTLVSSAHCCTDSICEREESTPSIWEVFADSWTYPGKTECPTPRSCIVLAYPWATLCSASADCAGWVMSTAWTMATSQNISSVES